MAKTKKIKKISKPLNIDHVVINGSYVPDNHQEMSEFETGDLLDNRVVIQELLDGPLIKIQFTMDGHISARFNNISILDNTKYRLLKTWLTKHTSGLMMALGNNRILYGHWLEYEYSTYYDKLPDVFIVSDIYDTVSNKYWNAYRIIEFCNSLQLTNNYIITEAPITFNIIEKIANDKSYYSSESIRKGVVIKFEDDYWTIKKAAFIRPNYKEKIGTRKNIININLRKRRLNWYHPGY